MKNTIYFVIFIIFLTTLLHANDVNLKITSYVDKNEITLAESVELTVEISANKDVDVEPIFPQLTGFRIIAQSSSSSTSIQIVNGKMSQSITKSFIYTLNPYKIGQIVIPPISAKYNNKSYRTQSIIIEVKDTPKSPKSSTKKTPKEYRKSSPKSSNNKIFLEAIVSKYNVFVGEPVSIRYKLYSLENLLGLNAEQLPEFSGFLKEETYQVKNITHNIESVGGIRYYAYKISDYILLPTYAGDFDLDPMKLICSYRVPAKNFFDFGSTERVRVISNDVKIHVKELPERNKPENFNGAIGNYTIKANVNADKVKANESITLTLVISGRGNIKMFEPPLLPPLTNVTTFPPEVSNELIDSYRSAGKKIIKYILIPEEPGDYTIPPIKFSYFDPDKEVYETISTRAIFVKAEKSSKKFLSHAFTRPEGIEMEGTDVCFIINVSEIKSHKFIYLNWWYWIIIFLFVFLIFIAYIYRKEKDKMLKDKAYYRLKISNKQLQNDLKSIKNSLNSDKFEDFFVKAENTLKNYIANKCNLPPSNTRMNDIIKVLKRNNIDKDLIKNIKSFLQFTDFARFSGKNYSKKEIEKLHDNLISIIKKLSKIKFRRKS